MANTIIIASDSALSVTVSRDGVPVPVSGVVQASVSSMAGSQLLPARAVPADAPGASWADGVVVVPLLAAETALLPAGDAMLVLSGSFGVKRFRVHVEAVGQIVRSLLFVRDLAVEQMREDRLVMAANSVMPDLKVTDNFLWDKLLAAEAHIAHSLRVPLAPTRFFASQPSAEQIAALGGQPWAIDPPYDYNPSDWYGDKWGLILARQKPIQSILGLKFVYPSPANTIVDVPADWIRLDAKYGQIQVVPTGTAYQTLLGGLFMSHLSGGKTLPFTVHMDYVAGLSNVERDFPDLIDATMKLAVVKVIEDAVLPQSGSISADGLSQSVSVDAAKYHEAVERILNGSDGNGGLMARIHGIRTMVI